MSKKFVDITNISGGSVSLPGFGILRSEKTASVEASLLEMTDYRVFLKKGVIATGNAKEVERKKLQLEKDRVAELQKAESLQKKEKQGKTIKRVGGENEDASEFENGVEPGEEDNIIFVDIEQKRARLANHPILGKKQR